MEIVVSLFMLSVYCVMIAGMGGVISSWLGISYVPAVISMSFVCLLFIFTDIRGVVVLSTFVTPVLIIGIITVGLYLILFRDITVFNAFSCFSAVTKNWFFSALIYVSYNSIVSIVIMCGLLPYLKTRRVGIVGGILGGGLLCIIALLLNFVIYLFYPEALTSELPVLCMIQKYNYMLTGIYTLILWLAMLVSAVTSGYCFVDRVGKRIRIGKRLLAMLFCAVAVPMSNFGFSGLIAVLYPIFGYAGLFMVFVVLVQGLRHTPAILSKKSTNR